MYGGSDGCRSHLHAHRQAETERQAERERVDQHLHDGRGSWIISSLPLSVYVHPCVYVCACVCVFVLVHVGFCVCVYMCTCDRLSNTNKHQVCYQAVGCGPTASVHIMNPDHPLHPHHHQTPHHHVIVPTATQHQTTAAVTI